jgi:hypothetical protein
LKGREHVPPPSRGRLGGGWGKFWLIISQLDDIIEYFQFTTHSIVLYDAHYNFNGDLHRRQERKLKFTDIDVNDRSY